ncbi:hypothetical protein [Lacticaseibacillus manihotivorans]|uniref:DUF1642 domain-containing protein n=1 Tax=Lacticaseibacillus manihotivorans TaxID=88233 RepID=A0A5P8JRV0_9LACO|nr:hypothetical protein [Lacticaseibacillus manihotivorans]QFQ91776.1 hypothetical protein LM010_10230 [Lacticaseibacillus manihotivorans]
MNYETKQDVFDETLSNLKKMDTQIEGEWGYSQLTMGVGKHGDVESTREIAIAEIRDRYASALPDDLPVIPLTVGEYIEEVKAHGKFSIIDPLWRVSDALSTIGESVLGDRSRWVLHHSDDFARAWVLGAWRVEETGEIVKLEAEK